ncbi:MAG: mannitol dehydrogenase [Clostridiales bacterium]|nr:mannitol dehydrogenase [Clostridiales bacterium]
MKKFIMYGAGNIGRGFIGQTFSNAGYKVGFIDINKEVINRLNEDKCYPVHVVTTDANVEHLVNNVYGIDGTDIELVSNEIAECDMMATAIGVNVLKFIAKPIALGIKKRFERGGSPLNIIICENLIGADEFLKSLIKDQLPEMHDIIDEKVGFIEASIGRMVPVMTEEKKQGNPLRVYVEPYNILPVDKAAFKSEIPNVENLYPFSPFNLFIQRKLFMHNMSHALCAYLGYLRRYNYIYETVGDYDIKYSAYRALISSALAVSKENDVDIKVLIDHADDLLIRFSNTALGDTVARVGKDTKRKLGSNDRLMGALKLCEKHGVDASYLCLGVAAGLSFNPDGDDSSIEVCDYTAKNGVEMALKTYSDYCGMYVALISELYLDIKNGESLDSLIKKIEKYNGKTIKV